MTAVSYKLKDAERAYGISVQQLRKLVRAGKLEARLNGNVWLILAEDLDRYIKNLPTVI